MKEQRYFTYPPVEYHCYIASNGRMISKQWTGKDMEGSGRGPVWEIILSFAWRDWGKPRKLQSREPVSGSRFEPQTWIQSRSATHLTVTFQFWSTFTYFTWGFLKTNCTEIMDFLTYYDTPNKSLWQMLYGCQATK
jgi:hypothetical protein